MKNSNRFLNLQSFVPGTSHGFAETTLKISAVSAVEDDEARESLRLSISFTFTKAVNKEREKGYMYKTVMKRNKKKVHCKQFS